MSLQQSVIDAYISRFKQPPTWVVRAPGRVNLIGEHTDYNGGFVMPMAIDRYTWIALGPREDGRVIFYAMDHDETAEITLTDIQKEPANWREYIKGVAWVLQEDGYALKGWQGTSACNVPMGAGLSSSASFELAVAKAFSLVSEFAWDAPQMALLSQKAENAWVGVNCGIMDQMISATGQEGFAVLIDCRSLEFKRVPLPPNTAVVIMDTSTRRGLVDSAYNERRRQCEEASRFFGVDLLRDVSVELFETRQHELPELTRKRARHVVTENDRTVQAAAAMEAGDSETLGRLMDASHESLRDDFEVSNEALDVIVEIAQRDEATIGARMTGAGFGGCAVALIHEAATDAFVSRISKAYKEATGLTSSLYVCYPSNGAEELT